MNPSNFVKKNYVFRGKAKLPMRCIEREQQLCTYIEMIASAMHEFSALKNSVSYALGKIPLMN